MYIYPAYQPATGHVAMSLNVLVVPNTNKHYKDVSKFGRTRKPSTNISFQTIFYMITIYRPMPGFFPKSCNMFHLYKTNVFF